MLARVADGTDFDLGRTRGNAYDHAQRGREPVILGAHFLDHAADHVLGSVKVGDDTVAQGAHGADALVDLAVHLTGAFTDGDRLVSFGVKCHDRGFVNDDAVIMDDNGVGCS